MGLGQYSVDLQNSGDGTSTELRRIFAKDPQYAVTWVADKYGIRLPPGYKWGYLSGAPDPLLSRLCNLADCILGWNPRDDQENQLTGPYNDNDVYLTYYAFKNFNWDPAGVAAIIAHEARHAWVEYYVEQTFPEDPYVARNNISIAAGEQDATYASLYMSNYYGLSLSAEAMRGEIQYRQSNCLPNDCVGALNRITIYGQEIKIPYGPEFGQP